MSSTNAFNNMCLNNVIEFGVTPFNIIFFKLSPFLKTP
uniref:DNA methylase_3 n=1 Tax=Helicobacter pylori TaxID=210 RepID=A0A3G1LY21_HELPX|nr:DNA methylase_3 [Helicobacter pylori]